MVVFTMTAQILDTIILKFTVFTIEQIWCLAKWGGSSVYYYYYPLLSDADKLRLENMRLRDEIKLLKDTPENAPDITDAE